VAAAATGAGDLVGGWDWPVILLVPLALAVALLTAVALARASEPGSARRREGGTSRALARPAADDRPSA
jgi:hypothetical protein